MKFWYYRFQAVGEANMQANRILGATIRGLFK